MKTKGPHALNEEVEALNDMLHELTEEELEQISGGSCAPIIPAPSTSPLPCEYSFHADLTACPYTEGERHEYNCINCRLNNLTMN